MSIHFSKFWLGSEAARVQRSRLEVMPDTQRGMGEAWFS